MSDKTTLLKAGTGTEPGVGDSRLVCGDADIDAALCVWSMCRSANQVGLPLIVPQSVHWWGVSERLKACQIDTAAELTDSRYATVSVGGYSRPRDCFGNIAPGPK
jgi:hypothetical protein